MSTEVKALTKFRRLPGEARARLASTARGGPDDPWWARSFFPINLAFVVFAFLWLFVVPFHGFGGWDWSLGGCVGRITVFLLAMWGSHAAATLLRKRLGFPIPQHTEVSKILRKNRTVAFVFIVLVAPLSEEWLFRYAMLGIVPESYLSWAVVGSSFAFALGHQSNKPLKFLMGLAFCWLYLGSGTIWVPVAAHALLNLTAFVVNLLAYLQKVKKVAVLEAELDILREEWAAHKAEFHRLLVRIVDPACHEDEEDILPHQEKGDALLDRIQTLTRKIHEQEP